MKRFLSIALLLALAVSCEIPFEFTPEAGPCLYVQAVAEDGAVVVTPFVALPVNGSTSADGPIRGEVSVNGTLVQTISTASGQAVTIPCDLQDGDAVSVRLSADGLASAEGETALPPALKVTDVAMETFPVDTLQVTKVTLTLDHAPSAEEYYGIQIHAHIRNEYEDGKQEEVDEFQTPGYILTMMELLNFDLENYMQVNWDGRLLGCPEPRLLTFVTARQFKGNRYQFLLNSYDALILNGIRDGMPGGDTGMVGGGIVSGNVGSGGKEKEKAPKPVSSHTEYTVEFYRLSDSFYQYGKTLYQSNFDFLSNMGFTPANFTWGNVRGGMGFVGAVSSWSFGPFSPDKEN